MWRPGKLRFLIGVKNPLPIDRPATARKHGPLRGPAGRQIRNSGRATPSLRHASADGFTIASALCGAATSLGELEVARDRADQWSDGHCQGGAFPAVPQSDAVRACLSARWHQHHQAIEIATLKCLKMS